MAAGLVTILIILCGGTLALLLFAFWIWMLIDCIRNKGLGDTEKILWFLVIFFLHALGALVYFFAGRSRRL